MVLCLCDEEKTRVDCDGWTDTPFERECAVPFFLPVPKKDLNCNLEDKVKFD